MQKFRNPESSILKRQRMEWNEQRQLSQINEMNKIMAKVTFEQRTSSKIRKLEIERRIERSRQLAAEDLENRRKKLRTLLLNEEERYQQEIQDGFETPEQRRARMHERARELKAEREAERQRQVAELRERQFRTNCDDVRGVDSRNWVRQVANERTSQLHERQRMTSTQMAEESRFAQMWEEDKRRKDEKARQEEIERKEKDILMKQRLDEQVQQRNEMLQREMDQHRLEAEAMNARWHEIKLRELERERELRDLDREDEAAVQEENKRWLEHKRAVAEAEKSDDIRRLNEALGREQADMERENALKQQRCEEARQFRRDLEEQMKREQDDHRYIEGLYEEEQEKEWRRKEMVWKREQDARDRLNIEVHETRQAQLVEKARIDAARKEEDDRLAIQWKMDALEQEKQERDKQRKRIGEAHRGRHMLERQIHERDQQRVAENQLKYLEGKMMQRSEEQYNARLGHVMNAQAPSRDFRRKKMDWN
eukprot:TRINITY_DN3722_c0_g1_i1.p1 TRINITY_DN3722_c0_g1~~TRINITY_DN3722_c0_g1_i1.p1  ORF type:complete len:483 (-),score=207.65 TRINITY_DN3722_c0_g1_i1:193-1641(-)